MSGVDEQVLEMVAVQLGVDRVAEEDSLVEELGAESADVLNLVANLEDRYDIEIAEEEIPELTTAGEVVALVRRRVGESGPR